MSKLINKIESLDLENLNKESIEKLIQSIFYRFKRSVSEIVGEDLFIKKFGSLDHELSKNRTEHNFENLLSYINEIQKYLSNSNYEDFPNIEDIKKPKELLSKLDEIIEYISKSDLIISDETSSLITIDKNSFKEDIIKILKNIIQEITLNSKSSFYFSELANKLEEISNISKSSEYSILDLKTEIVTIVEKIIDQSCCKSLGKGQNSIIFEKYYGGNPELKEKILRKILYKSIEGKDFI